MDACIAALPVTQAAGMSVTVGDVTILEITLSLH